MSPLEQLRANQHNDRITPDEVKAWDWLEHLTPADVLPDLAAHLSASEQVLLNQARRNAA